jgi:hypothetical protein
MFDTLPLTNKQFLTLKQECDTYWAFLQEIHNDEKYEEVFNICRSSFIMILYNMIESITTNLLLEIYDTFDKREVSYYQLINDIKNCWLKINKNNKNFPKKINNTEDIDSIIKMIENPLIFSNQDISNDTQEFVVFLKRCFNLNGTIDIYALKKFSEDHGISLNLPDQGHGRTLSTLKNNRNHLAHGERSFNQIGETCQLYNLENWKDHVFELLEQFIKQIAAYISQKQYLHNNVNN